jgi:hypothetical protein
MANFFAENWQKSQKIVIITSTPGIDGVILKIFSPKSEKVSFLTKKGPIHRYSTKMPIFRRKNGKNECNFL